MRDRIVLLSLGIFYLMLPAIAFAQTMRMIPEPASTFSLDMIFTFLFLTLGPLKIVKRFAVLTKGRDFAFRKKLALVSSVIALLAAVIATTAGAKILMTWHISHAAISLTAGILLFVIAIQDIMKQYGIQDTAKEKKPDEPEPSVVELAFAPLAFPTIVTPYGIALLIVLATIAHGEMWKILGLTTVIFVLNFLTMLGATYIAKWPIAGALFAILGAVMAVLQVALGIQAIINAFHVLQATT